jgi:hypothetical protein
MTDKQRKKLLARATPEYAQNFINKLGEDIYEQDLTITLADFAKEVIQPRANEKEGNGHH